MNRASAEDPDEAAALTDPPPPWAGTGAGVVWAARPDGTAKPARITSQDSRRLPIGRAEVLNGRPSPRGPVEPIHDSRTGAAPIQMPGQRDKHERTTKA